MTWRMKAGKSLPGRWEGLTDTWDREGLVLTAQDKLEERREAWGRKNTQEMRDTSVWQDTVFAGVEPSL